MNQTVSLQQLTDRLVRVKEEMSIIRKDLADLRQQTEAVPQAITASSAVAHPWADKGDQMHWIKDLFAALSIQGVSVGAEVLQQMTGQLDLTPNEPSRGLVEARKE